MIRKRLSPVYAGKSTHISHKVIASLLPAPSHVDDVAVDAQPTSTQLIPKLELNTVSAPTQVTLIQPSQYTKMPLTKFRSTKEEQDPRGVGSRGRQVRWVARPQMQETVV